MAKRSIEWPPTSPGRIVMHPDPADAQGDEVGASLRQVIAHRLLDGQSANPWNERQGLGIKDPTFRGQRPADRAFLRAEVRRHFKALERQRRARLVNGSLEVTFPAPGQALISLEYVNLESGGRESLEVSRVNA